MHVYTCTHIMMAADHTQAEDTAGGGAIHSSAKAESS